MLNFTTSCTGSSWELLRTPQCIASELSPHYQTNRNGLEASFPLVTSKEN